MSRFTSVGTILLGACCFAWASQVLSSGSYIWRGYGGDSYHSAVSSVQSSPLNKIHWSTSLDDQRSYYGDEVLIHYAAPCINAQNVVVHSYRYTTTVGGNPDYDNWSVYARNGSNGSVDWSLNTDYSAPLVYPSDWTTVYPLALLNTNNVVAAGGGGTVLLVTTSGNGSVGSNSTQATKAPTTTTTRLSFYSQYANYNQNPSAYKNIKINTPFMTTSSGDIYFGYAVVGSVPSTLTNVVGTGGVVHISSSRQITFKTIGSYGIDSSVARPAMNASPALSEDGKSVYYAICDSGTYDAYLVKLDASALGLQASARLWDPSVSGGPAGAINESSASPMVGPDGHVYYGVFGYYWRESHGWMLQFDANLNPNDQNGNRWPEGSFGWDDTPSVVKSSLVSSYTGSAPYLILTKYNNYAIEDGDGVNKVAVLDPTSNTVSRDRQSGIPVMNEILTVVGPTPDQNARNQGYPNAVCEWCINSAAIDPASDSAIVNSEDGHCYRWSFATNTLTQGVNLAPATGEAYTSTSIGPDGTSYAINNAILFGMGN